MKRTAFKRKGYTPRPVKTIEYTPKPRSTAVARPDGTARMVVAVPKTAPLQHRGYMAMVRQMRCARCGWYQPRGIQFCHADEGKGAGIKSDCRLGWPGCGPHDGLNGCHYDIGTARVLPKEERREFERAAGARTRATIIAEGAWPKSLPPYKEDPT